MRLYGGLISGKPRGPVTTRALPAISSVSLAAALRSPAWSSAMAAMEDWEGM